MKSTGLWQKNKEDLIAELINLRREEFNFRMQITTKQLNNTARLKYFRRDIARVKTILNRKDGNE